MASSLILLLFTSFLLLPHSTSNPPAVAAAGASESQTPAAAIQQACRATRYPDACESAVTNSGRVGLSPNPEDIIQAAFSSSGENLKAGREMVQDILDASARDRNRSRAAQSCLVGLSLAEHRANAAVEALTRGKLRDARAWGSAALAYQYGCWSGLQYVNNSAAVNSTMSFFDTTLVVLTSNAVSMLQALDAIGPDPASWTPPLTERDEFWEPVVGDGPYVGPDFDIVGLAADATVSQDGASGCYKSVQEAVDAAPENLEGGKRFVIRIKEGVYEETVRVAFNKRNVVFVGDGKGKTVISGSRNVGLMGITTYDTATVGVIGDGFMASGLTFQNTAGPGAGQAVAFRSSSDFSYIENCEFLGNQDTLYVHSLRQLFRSCHIEGNVDFIFGSAAAIFQDCTILVRPRQVTPELGEVNTISAHGRTDPAQTTGFAFLNCLINGTDDYMKLYHSQPNKHLSYLGRPWKMYSRTLYINCTMETLISRDGWMPWDADFALSTLYYGEFGNSGPGADLSKRVSWISQIPAEHVSTYYAQNFVQGDEWITKAS